MQWSQKTDTFGCMQNKAIWTQKDYPFKFIKKTKDKKEYDELTQARRYSRNMLMAKDHLPRSTEDSLWMIEVIIMVENV